VTITGSVVNIEPPPAGTLTPGGTVKLTSGKTWLGTTTLTRAGTFTTSLTLKPRTYADTVQ
jgi:hypothetical protein